MGSWVRGRVYDVFKTCQGYIILQRTIRVLTRSLGAAEGVTLFAAPGSVPWGVAPALTRLGSTRVLGCVGCAEAVLDGLLRVSAL